MPELPNLLRQRLAVTEKGRVEAHPDADTLTAYLEQSLASTERQTVVAHLAVCEPCREVVVLSQSLLAEPALQTVLAPAAVPRWRRLFTPAFTATVSLAAMAVIAVVVLQLPQRHSQNSSNRQPANQQSANHRTADQSAQETQQAQAAPVGDEFRFKAQEAPPAPAETRSSQVTNRVVASKTADKKREELSATSATVAVAPAASAAGDSPDSPAKVAVLTRGLQKKDYVNTNFFNTSSADSVVLDSQGNSFPSTPQPQPSVTGGAFSTGNSKMTIFADLPANPAGKSNAHLVAPVHPQEHSGFPFGKIVQSTARNLHFRSPIGTPALRAGTLTTSTMGEPGMFSGTIEKSQSTEVSPAPERADVDSLTASSSLSPGALSTFGSRFNDSASPRWKVAGGKLMKFAGQSQWEDAYPVAAAIVEFSVVNARENDIWAGGSHAFIIHSRDGGVTWETIKLGDNASGTIVSIIAGTMSAQIKTSDNQLWSSADGGKTWTLRSE